MKRHAFFLLAALSLLAAGCNQVNEKQSPAYHQALTVGANQLWVEVAANAKAQERGLSGRNVLGENQGMLFDFRSESPTTRSFWMSNMKFGLDLIWINNHRVIGITAKVPPPAPDRPLVNYFPPGPVNMVLEVNSGWSEKHGVRVGDEIRLE